MPPARSVGLFFACLLAVTPAFAVEPGLTRAVPETLVAPHVQPAVGFQAEGVEAIFYDALPWKGKPTRVFAWVGMPKVEPGQKVPGIVLVHGGGGTAFDTWVRLWTSRGYAAIAMDTCGTVPRGTYGKWERHDAGGPPGPDFPGSDQPVADQWPYHAVSDVILAHSLLRARPEVDADRIGLTGISWGGYLTCLVSGLDDRFKFAAPVYGCGFLGENSVWKPEFDKLGERGQRWLDLWDPKHYLPQGKMPKLWVTGTNDFAYPMDSLRKSYEIAGGESTLCIRPRMPHGHGAAGENPEEIRAFADSILKGGKPLIRTNGVLQIGLDSICSFDSGSSIVKAEIIWTKDEGNWTERRWEAMEAKLNVVEKDPTEKSNAGVAEVRSASASAPSSCYFFNLTDDRGRVVSSRLVTNAP